ncbi:hypothetical protein Droror1_Dr00009449 [Drosera rotundifolia]
MKNQLGKDGRSYCELCEKKARMYCESDKARLCFDCDRKVHVANFLIAKHCRTLLCHLYRSLAPWKATGPNLGSVVSLCHDCVSIKSNYTPMVQSKAWTRLRRKRSEFGVKMESEIGVRKWSSMRRRHQCGPVEAAGNCLVGCGPVTENLAVVDLKLFTHGWRRERRYRGFSASSVHGQPGNLYGCWPEWWWSSESRTTIKATVFHGGERRGSWGVLGIVRTREGCRQRWVSIGVG